MSDYVFPASARAREYLEAIKAEMIEIFGMSEMEAVGRINRQWDGLPFIADDQVDALSHETPDFWAKWIAYGRKDFWLNESELQVTPYP